MLEPALFMSIKISWRFICSSIKTKIWEPFSKYLFLKRQIIHTMDDRNYSCLCFRTDWYKYISILYNNQKDITLVIFKWFDVLMNFEFFNFDQSLTGSQPRWLNGFHTTNIYWLKMGEKRTSLEIMPEAFIYQTSFFCLCHGFCLVVRVFKHKL